MAELFIHKLVHVFLIIIIIYLNNVLGDSSNYVRHILEEEELCHPFGRTKSVDISDSAIIVVSSYRFKTALHRDLTCKFKIKASKKAVMAVVQDLSFRYDFEDDKCIDYIQFKGKMFGESDKFCRGFGFGLMDPIGEIETTIFVSNKTLEPYDSPINITIVYTPFKSSNPGCYTRIAGGEGLHCVSDKYYCDGLKNCLPEICNDEKDCARKIYSNGTGTKVTIAAVTTIFLCFIIFIISLWICRRYKKLCWSSDCAGPRPNDDRFRTNSNENNAANQSIASAPILEVSVLSSSADKDLPPSYDSLFPPNQTT